MHLPKYIGTEKTLFSDYAYIFVFSYLFLSDIVLEANLFRRSLRMKFDLNKINLLRLTML